MSKTKLLIEELILENIEEKFNIKILGEADRYPRQFNYGDFVINGHGVAGFIQNDYDLNKDIRVHVGNTIQISVTGDDGYDTLEINNFHVFNIKKNETEND